MGVEWMVQANVTDLCCLQCFDAVGWVTGRTYIQPVKELVPLMTKSSILGQLEKEV